MATINGSTLDDMIRGTLTSDQINGLSGNDFLFGDSGDDSLFGADGDDVLDGWNGNDILAGDTGNDLLMGNDGNDILDGGRGNDSLYGEADNDYLVGSVGFDLMHGGSGTDIVDYSFLNSAISLEAAGVVNKGNAGVDQVFAVETIIGAEGFANAIDGSTGDSTVVSFEVDLTASSLTVNGIPGLGTQSFTVENFVNVFGTTQDDSITGDNSNNILDGGAGNDIAFGAGGDDLIVGDLGNDALGGGNGNDSVFGGEGNDFMLGGNGFDLMDGGAGTDIVDYSLLDGAISLEAAGAVNKGAAGVDQVLGVETIIGAEGVANAIDGTTGDSSVVSFDVDLTVNNLTVNGIPGLGTQSFTVENFVNVFGTTQDDSIVGNSSANILDGGAGNDIAFGDDGDDLVVGNLGNDALGGGNGNDSVFGGEGNDFMLGGNGFDLMDGGAGDDIVDYSLLDGAISLEAAGVVNKGTAGVDQVFAVETIIGAEGFANTVDGFTGESGTTSFEVDLSNESLVVNGIPGLGSLSFTIQNFLNVNGTSQADNVIGNNINNILSGGGGDDLLAGGSGADTLDGGSGDDDLFGESGDDLLLGFTGDDVLVGGAGSDSLLGESGNDALAGYGFTVEEYDLLSGGAGSDAFFLGDTSGIYYQGLGYATITDFNNAEGDAILLAGSANLYNLGVQNFVGGSELDTLIYFNDDLIGVVQDSTTVNAQDFFYV